MNNRPLESKNEKIQIQSSSSSVESKKRETRLNPFKYEDRDKILALYPAFFGIVDIDLLVLGYLIDAELTTSTSFSLYSSKSTFSFFELGLCQKYLNKVWKYAVEREKEEYELLLMSELPEKDNKKAVRGTIYVGPTGDYVVHSFEGKIGSGTIKNLESKNVETKIKEKDDNVREKIIEATLKAGHTTNEVFLKLDTELQKNPQLLLEYNTIADFIENRCHKGKTLYQLVLGMLDGNVYSKNGTLVQKGTIEMIEKHFYRLPNKTKEEIAQIIEKQRKEQFPEGCEALEKKKIETGSKSIRNIFEAIKNASQDDCAAIIAVEENIHRIIRSEKNSMTYNKELDQLVRSVMKAKTDKEFEEEFKNFENYLKKSELIKNDKFNFTALKTLYQFRNTMEPKGPTQGLHFNIELLQLVDELYDSHYENFGTIDWNGQRYESPKNLLAWRMVYGYVQRFDVACNLVLWAQGSWGILMDGDLSLGSLNYTYGTGKHLPIANPILELGYNCAGARADEDGGWGRASGGGRTRLFGILMSGKNSVLENLCNTQTIQNRARA